MKDISGFEGLYAVTTDGKVWSYRAKRYLQVYTVKDGVQKVSLNKQGKQWTKSVHRLVAETYIENTEEKPQVDHIDGDKTNNCVSNLRWCTNSENQAFRSTQDNSGKEAKAKQVQWGDKTFNSIGEAARYIANLRGSSYETVRKELKAAKVAPKTVYGKLVVIVGEE